MKLSNRLQRLARGDVAETSVGVRIPDPASREEVTPLSKIKDKADVLSMFLKTHAKGPEGKELDDLIQKLNKRVSSAKSGLADLAKKLVPDGSGDDAGDGDTAGEDPFADMGGDGLGGDATNEGPLKQSALQEIADAITEASEALAPIEELATYLKSLQDQSRKDTAPSPDASKKPGKDVPVKPEPKSKPKEAPGGPKPSGGNPNKTNLPALGK